MSLLQIMESCFHGDGWMLACPWDSVNELFVLLYLCLWLLHYLLKCLYLRTQIFPFFFSSNSLSHPTRWDWESSCVGLIWWLGLNNDIYQKQSCFRLLDWLLNLDAIVPSDVSHLISLSVHFLLVKMVLILNLFVVGKISVWILSSSTEIWDLLADFASKYLVKDID